MNRPPGYAILKVRGVPVDGVTSVLRPYLSVYCPLVLPLRPINDEQPARRVYRGPVLVDGPTTGIPQRLVARIRANQPHWPPLRIELAGEVYDEAIHGILN